MPLVHREDQNGDGYLQPENHRQGYRADANDNSHAVQSDYQRQYAEGYLKPVPSSQDARETTHVTTPLSGATNPYSTPYDHFPLREITSH